MRVGLVVPRFKQSAVDRNRLKRRLRELARLRLLPTDIAADVVLRIRPDAYRASFEALATDVDRALAQLARWRPTVAEVATVATPAREAVERGAEPER
jgi:ribonuclease P protein component